MALREEMIKSKKDWFDELNKLNCKYSDLNRIKTIIEFIKTDAVEKKFEELNSKFDSTEGNKAIPRQIVIRALMYCYNDYMDKYSDIALRCRTDVILKVFTSNRSLSESLFRNVLNESDPEIINDLFLITLLKFNDETLLKFLHMFIDGTNAICRGSKFTIIHKTDVKILRWLHDNNLTYKRNKQKQLKIKIQQLENLKAKDNVDEEIIDEIIQRIMDRHYLFTTEMAKKLDLWVCPVIVI